MAKDNNSEAAKKVAEAEKASKKKATSKPKNADGNVFPRAGKAIAKYFKDLRGEKKKIIWPNGKMVLKSTLVVIVCVLIVGVVIWLADFGLSKGIDAVLKIGQSEETTVAAEEANGAEAVAQTVPEVVNEASSAAEEATATSEAESAPEEATEAETAKEEATEPVSEAETAAEVKTAD